MHIRHVCCAGLGRLAKYLSGIHLLDSDHGFRLPWPMCEHRIRIVLAFGLGSTGVKPYLSVCNPHALFESKFFVQTLSQRKLSPKQPHLVVLSFDAFLDGFLTCFSIPTSTRDVSVILLFLGGC